MKVKNMTSAKGNKIANQFIIENECLSHRTIVFQSYSSTIVEKWVYKDTEEVVVFLDKTYWDYSVTTGKYRNMFLGETKKETQAKIDSGEYKLVNLN